MTKKVLLLVALAVLVGCQSIQYAESEFITLPNGKPGLILDCTVYGWSSCFKTAGELCLSGYAIHERTMDKNIKSEIPIESLEPQSTVVVDPMNGNSYYEKYMVISCR